VSPPNTMWPGPMPTCVPSFILIHPSVWPQYINITDTQEDTQDRQDRQRTVWYHRANRFRNGRSKTTTSLEKQVGHIIENSPKNLG